jgi:hypothetical protein
VVSNGADIQQSQNHQLAKLLDELFKIILEILNFSKEIYVSLYTMMCVAAFAHSLTDLAKTYNT